MRIKNWSHKFYLGWIPFDKDRAINLILGHHNREAMVFFIYIYKIYRVLSK